MNDEFRLANTEDIPQIWGILQEAIQRRKKDGSDQWQDGYPNPELIQNDIENGYGYVLAKGDAILGYTAILISDEPEYDRLEGEWLTNGDFVVFHRVAISGKYLGKGLAKKMMQCIENFAKENNIHSIKADTNHDNPAMMRIFEKLGYTYCGRVYFRGSPRKAFEKVLSEKSTT